MKQSVLIALLLLSSGTITAQLSQIDSILTTNYDYVANSIYTNNLLFNNDTIFSVNMARPFAPFPVTQRHAVLSYKPVGGNWSHQSVFGTQSGFPNLDIGFTGSTQGTLGVLGNQGKFALKNGLSFSVKDAPGNGTFVFSNGNIFLGSNLNRLSFTLYKSDNLGDSWAVIDSLARFHPDIVYCSSPGGVEVDVFKSPNEQYIVMLGTCEGDGHVYSGIAENRADNIWIMFSSDFGTTWDAKRVAADGVINLVQGYHTPNFAPLFENFSQISGAVDNSGIVHIVANGYGLVFSGTTLVGNSFPVLYWNSSTEVWKSISSQDIDTLTSISDFYPTSKIGQSYPSIGISEDGQTLYAIWTGPQRNEASPIGIDTSGGLFWTDLYHAASSDGGNTWVYGGTASSKPDRSDTYGTSAQFLRYINSAFYADITWMEDLTTGVGPFDGILTDNPIMYALVNTTDILTDVGEGTGSINTFTLYQNYPNPFNPVTKISYRLEKHDRVTLKIYDVLGSHVTTLINSEMSSGLHEVNFNAVNLASGVYYYQLRSGEFIRTNKMILLK